MTMAAILRHTHEVAATSGISEMNLMWALMALMVICEVSMLVTMRHMHKRISHLEQHPVSS